MSENTADPRWITYTNERLIPAPREKVKVGLIKQLAGIPNDHVLIRDHNSPHDPVFDDDDLELTLREGNVFKSAPSCEVQNGSDNRCSAPPKYAISVDDAVELAVNPILSGQTLRDLSNVGVDRQLLRDYESPRDEKIGKGDEIDLRDGPVFITKKCCESSLEIATPKGVFTSTFPFTTKLSEIIAAAVAKLGLSGGDVFELVRDGVVLQPLDGSLASLAFGCEAKLELVATGSGV